MREPDRIRITPRPWRLALAGLAQALLLLVAIWTILPGPQSHDYLRASAVLALSLLPIGWGLRLPWLSLGALGWGLLGFLLAGQRQRLGLGPDGVGSITILPVVLTSFAAAAGQWLNLNLLPLRRFAQTVRGLTQLTIACCLLLLLAYLGGGVGLGVVLALLGTALADLSLTVLTLILAVTGRRQGD